MPDKKITFKGMFSKMGDKRIVVIPKDLVSKNDLDELRERRLRITMIFEELR